MPLPREGTEISGAWKGDLLMVRLGLGAVIGVVLFTAAGVVGAVYAPTDNYLRAQGKIQTLA